MKGRKEGGGNTNERRGGRGETKDFGGQLKLRESVTIRRGKGEIKKGVHERVGRWCSHI